MSAWGAAWGDAWGSAWGGDGAVVSDAVIQTGHGRVRRREDLVSVTIDGEVKVFQSLDAALAFVESLRPAEVRKAKKKAREDARRIVSAGKAKVIPPAPVVAIKAPSEAVDVIAYLQSKVEIAYYRALSEEMAKIAKEDEDIAMIASLL
jgi:ribosomal protein L30E